MKHFASFLLLFVAVALFLAAMVVGGALLIPIGLIVLVISERRFRREIRN